VKWARRRRRCDERRRWQRRRDMLRCIKKNCTLWNVAFWLTNIQVWCWIGRDGTLQVVVWDGDDGMIRACEDFMFLNVLDARNVKTEYSIRWHASFLDRVFFFSLCTQWRSSRHIITQGWWLSIFSFLCLCVQITCWCCLWCNSTMYIMVASCMSFLALEIAHVARHTLLLVFVICLCATTQPLFFLCWDLVLDAFVEGSWLLN